MIVDSRQARSLHHLVSDLMGPSRAIFWVDFLLSAAIGWGSLVLGAHPRSPLWLRVACFPLSTVAMWRAVHFLHEVVHLKRKAVPGFAVAWNVLVGIPVLMPSFLYRRHTDHHQATRYGTREDPEYTPLGRQSPVRVLRFMLEPLPAAALLWVRFSVLAPLSWIVPPLRRYVLAKVSTLTLNRDYVRRIPGPRERRMIVFQELCCMAWGHALVFLCATTRLPLPSLGFALGLTVAVTFLNQVMSLVAHRFENAGEQMTRDGQLLDSVTVTGHPVLSEIWAPLGNRYHAVHHLFPALPYHALPEAHRRLMAAPESDIPYSRAVTLSLWSAISELFAAQKRHADLK